MSRAGVYLRFGLGLWKKAPFNLLVQVTNRCNLTCSFCDFWPNGAHPGQELTLADFERLGDELAEIGTFLISIEGGEPFVRKDLAGIVRALSRKHLTVLYTNGWYVTDQAAREMFDAGLHQVGVSIDFASPDRHDAKRGQRGTFDRAWCAVESFRRAAKRGGQDVHVMTVLMEENRAELEPLLGLSLQAGVGHCITLLSQKGFRRGRKDSDKLPSSGISGELERLWRKYPHVRMFRGYLRRIDDFLAGQNMPECRAGVQSFNIDHLGNLSPCIERIHQSVGNVREAHVRELYARLARNTEISSCQDCWTLCRGVSQILGDRPGPAAWSDLMLRMTPRQFSSGR